MASSLTTFDAFLKERYTSDKIESLTYSERPCLAMLSKDSSGSGDLFVHPAIYANPQGLGATLAKAQAGAQQSTGGNLRGVKWTATWGDYSGAVEIGDKVIKASKDNQGAFLRNQSEEIDRLYEAFGDTMGYYVHADQGKALAVGTISSGIITVTAGTEASLANIEVGQILEVSANDGTSTAHALLTANVGYVVAVNRMAGTFTVATSSGGSAATPTDWTGTMYFFRAGDFGGGASPNRILLGFGAWVPASDPSSTTFEGVNRTLDLTRLSGVRLPSAMTSGKGIEQRLKLLVTAMTGRAGGPGPTHIFLNPENWQALADSLEARGNRPLEGGTAKFNFSKLQLAMAGKMVDIYSDRFVPINVAEAWHMPTVKLRSIDKFPHVINGDGLEMLRKSSSNDYEYRIQAYPAMIFAAPGFNGRVSLS